MPLTWYKGLQRVVIALVSCLAIKALVTYTQHTFSETHTENPAQID